MNKNVPKGINQLVEHFIKKNIGNYIHQHESKILI